MHPIEKANEEQKRKDNVKGFYEGLISKSRDNKRPGDPKRAGSLLKTADG